MIEMLLSNKLDIDKPLKFKPKLLRPSLGRTTTNAALVTDGVRYIYRYGGYGGSGSTPEAYLMRYDTVQNTWSSLGSYLKNSFMAGAYHNGILYFCGGSASFSMGTSDVWNRFDTYDTQTNQWGSKTAPGAVASASLVTVEDKLYLFGGRNANLTHSRALKVYDIPTNTWTTLAQAPLIANTANQSARQSVVAHDGKLYVFLHTPMSFMIYDILTNTWQILTDAFSTQNTLALLRDKIYHCANLALPMKEVDPATYQFRDSQIDPINESFTQFKYDLIKVGDKLFSTSGALVVEFTPY